MVVKTEIPDNYYFCLMEQTGGLSIEDGLLKLSGLVPRPEVQFLNYYKEVPVFAAAKILTVGENRLVCRTSEVQARAIEFNGYTIIEGVPFPHHVYANAHHDTDAGEITLSGFSYAEVHSNRRKSVRVRMQVPPVIGVEAGVTKFNGRMIDLSLTSCAVTIPDRKLLESFSFFYLTITMPSLANQPPVITRVMAKLTQVHQQNRVFRCIFLFEHDKSSEDRIGTLIARRQTEIIRELSS
ncbi:MAG: PilZ domain-containing protein [Desulfuromonadaceae bacterium]|nr:PilZ domain-containing protein [Desulfuromonadaceae bacterium]